MREIYKTDIEKIMKDLLDLKKISYVEQYPIRCKYGYILDFAIPELKIDIECDGSYWHKPNNSHDRKRNSFLMKNGWKIIRFTDEQLKKEIYICFAKIKEIIERRLKEDEIKNSSSRNSPLYNA